MTEEMRSFQAGYEAAFQEPDKDGVVFARCPSGFDVDEYEYGFAAGSSDRQSTDICFVFQVDIS
jgi:hypothetical protein